MMQSSANDASQHEVRRIGRNLSFTFAGKLTLYGLSAAWVIYLAPALGDRDFGLYSIVRAFVALFALVPDMGIGLVVIRDVAGDHTRAGSYLLNSLLAKAALALLAFALLLPLGGLLYGEVPIALFALAGFGVLAQAVGMVAVQGLQAVEQMGAAAAVELASHLTFIGGGLAAMLLGFGLEGVFWAMVAGGVVALVVGVPVVVARFRPARNDLSLPRTHYLLKEGFPLGLGSALGLIYLQADKLILGRVLGEAPTGWYNAAYVLYFTLIEVINTPVVVGSYPTLARYYRSDPVMLDKLLGKLVYAMVVIGLPLAVGGLFTADRLIDFIYRGAYPESGPVLMLLLWSLVLIFPNTILVQMLIVEGRQDRVLRLRALSAALAVALNLVAVAAWGYVGPAAAIFLVQAVVTALVAWWMRERVARLGLRVYWLRVVIAAAVMAAVCALTRDAHVLLTVGTAAVAYAAALVAVGGVKREDVALLRAALGR